MEIRIRHPFVILAGMTLKDQSTGRSGVVTSSRVIFGQLQYVRLPGVSRPLGCMEQVVELQEAATL